MSRAIATARPRTWRPWSSEWLAYVWSTVPGVILVLAFSHGLVSESLTMALFAVSFVGLNLMHMGATWARVYVRPGWRPKPIERLWVPLSLAVFAVSFEAVGGGALLLALQYFLSFHHALMQNYGLVRSSQRRSGRNLNPRLDMAACLLLPGAALVYRAGAICNLYSGAPLPTLPTALVGIAAIAGIVALTAFGKREWQAHRRGEHVDPIGIGILFGTNLIWSALLIADPHPAIPLYAFASGHYIQYLYFVWHAERRDAVTAESPLARRLQSTLRSSEVKYLIALLALGGLVTLLLTLASAALRSAALFTALRPEGALAIPPWAAAMIGINLEHYWLDHRIWRTPREIAPTAPLAVGASV